MDFLVEIHEKLQSGDTNAIRILINKALENNIGASEILDVMLGSMADLGRRFSNNTVFVPELLLASRAMNTGLEIIKPLLAHGEGQFVGKIIVGTVKGDLHDIGKNLVKIMLIGAGFDVIDLGVNVSKEKFIEAVEKEGAEIVAISALLTTTMENMREVVKAFNKTKFRSKIKIMVGGAPVTQTFAEKIGADIYTENAVSAAKAALELVS